MAGRNRVWSANTSKRRQIREIVPRRYPIRGYPDITHSMRCEYAVPDWDLAYPLTEGREVINPRPLDESAIFSFTETTLAE